MIYTRRAEQQGVTNRVVSFVLAISEVSKAEQDYRTDMYRPECSARIACARNRVSVGERRGVNLSVSQGSVHSGQYSGRCV
jgi:hypothetical protein